ncbi:MAG TPA: hypothetical protein VGI83_09915 [Gemmatimonadales bacterium]|jgi:hypothetical protein
MRHILSVAAGLVVLACTSSVDAGPLPVVQGTITAIAGQTYTVDDGVGSPCSLWRVSLGNALIQDGNGALVAPSSLTVGRTVSVWSIGVRESCPAQTTATRIVVN